MAQGINKVIIIGNVGRIEIKETHSGTVVNFSIATGSKYTDKKTGNVTETVDWHQCVAFQKTAEIIAQYVKKGTKLYVEGAIKTEKWQTQSGENRYTTKIIVREVQILTPKGENNENGENKQPQSDSGDYQKAKDGNGNVPPPPEAYQGESAFPEDDIPF